MALFPLAGRKSNRDRNCPSRMSWPTAELLTKPSGEQPRSAAPQRCGTARKAGAVSLTVVASRLPETGRLVRLKPLPLNQVFLLVTLSALLQARLPSSRAFVTDRLIAPPAEMI